MPKGISLMTIVHVIIIVYMSLGLAAQIKVRFKVGLDMVDAPPIFGRTVRDYSPALFSFPLGWAAFALRRWHREGTDLFQPGSTTLTLTGLSVLAALLAIAYIGTISIWTTGSLIQAKEQVRKDGANGD